jgi:hypothetical protein
MHTNRISSNDKYSVFFSARFGSKSEYVIIYSMMMGVDCGTGGGFKAIARIQEQR